MPKKALREEILARRRTLTAETCFALSLEIQERFIASAEFRDASVIALYSSILNEVFTEEICQVAQQRGKRVAYPRVNGICLEFVEIRDRAELVTGTFGILEPSGATVFPLREVELVLLPGVAFDQAGYRLGYGKGYYDRTLQESHQRPLLVGLAFELQVVEMLPAEIHDVRLNCLHTEERTVGFEGLPPEGVKINK